MEMTQIKSGTITLTLDPTDAIVLSRACTIAMVEVDGHGYDDDDAATAGLGISDSALALLYGALGTMFDAAGTAGFNQLSTPIREQEELTLTAIRENVYLANRPGKRSAREEDEEEEGKD